jgi:hypothetical protein
VSNYPNPVNDFTTVRYALQEGSTVHLSLYDAKGRQVATLIAGKWQDAGRYETVLDAARLANGIYFYRLQTDRQQQTGKMVVTR